MKQFLKDYLQKMVMNIKVIIFVLLCTALLVAIAFLVHIFFGVLAAPDIWRAVKWQVLGAILWIAIVLPMLTPLDKAWFGDKERNE